MQFKTYTVILWGPCLNSRTTPDLYGEPVMLKGWLRPPSVISLCMRLPSLLSETSTLTGTLVGSDRLFEFPLSFLCFLLLLLAPRHLALVHCRGTQSLDAPYFFPSSILRIDLTVPRPSRSRGGTAPPVAIPTAASLDGAGTLARLRALSPGPFPGNPVSRFPSPYMC